jgi:hypothetical protein
MIMTIDSLTGRVSKQEKDKWGRWTNQVFQGNVNQSIVIILAYQPINKGPVAG